MQSALDVEGKVEGKRPSEKEGDDTFHKVAVKVAATTGTSAAFVTALAVVVVWGITGPVFHFSDTWQLVINTGTTIVTFLMVFLIQNTQNRDSRAMQLKLDELIRATKRARNTFLDLESLSAKELEAYELEFQALRLRRLAHDERHAQALAAKTNQKVI